MKLVYIPLIIIAVAAVAFADVFIKKAATLGSFSVVIRSPWVFAAILLYILQVVIFTYVFVSGTKLVSVGAIQTGLYGIIILLSGMWIFGERLSMQEWIGLILTLGGVILLQI